MDDAATRKSTIFTRVKRGNYMRESIKIFVAFFGFFVSSSIAADEGLHTGTLLVATETNIQISYDYGGIRSFGVFCKPDICRTLKDLKRGDKVIVSLGPWQQKKRGNDVIQIRRCKLFDIECKRVNTAAQEQRKQNELSYKLRQQALKICEQKMYKTLELDGRFIKDKDKHYSLSGSDNFYNRFGAMLREPGSHDCAQAFLDNQESAVLEACQLHDCGDPIYYSCAELVFKIPNNEMKLRAVDQCK